MHFDIIYLEETNSTNRWLAENGGERDMLVWTDFQTAGRGCGTNTWESERGKNLLFSVYYHPKNVPAVEQFILSMAHALALHETLSDYTDDIKIKWPNDIYWHDKKIAGTLIETSLGNSHVKTCIFGTGLNINQTVFHSDAPNPVSLSQILGHEVSREDVLQKVAENNQRYLQMVEEGQWDAVRHHYRRHLHRLEESHYYVFGGKREYCKLIGVSNDGHLLLLPQGEQGTTTEPLCFAFKEVTFTF